MFRSILIPVDLSKKSGSAVSAASGLGDPATTTLHLLHVIETVEGVSYDEMEGFYSTLRERAEQVLNGWAAELAGKGFTVQRELVFGKRAPEIVRFASNEGCDLIVLTSHTVDPGRSGEGFGTISHQVAVLGRCSVLLVRPPDSDPEL
jgi:nucleotide-binding universal stress UspA family protein